MKFELKEEYDDILFQDISSDKIPYLKNISKDKKDNWMLPFKSEILKWLNSNIGIGNYSLIYYCSHDTFPIIENLYLELPTESDSVLFKLTWM